MKGGLQDRQRQVSKDRCVDQVRHRFPCVLVLIGPPSFSFNATSVAQRAPKNFRPAARLPRRVARRFTTSHLPYYYSVCGSYFNPARVPPRPLARAAIPAPNRRTETLGCRRRPRRQRRMLFIPLLFFLSFFLLFGLNFIFPLPFVFNLVGTTSSPSNLQKSTKKGNVEW